MSSHWADKYVGIPFGFGGRNWGEPLDCGGLVRIVLNREAQFAYPAYEGIDDIYKVLDLQSWKRIDNPQQFDLCLMLTPSKDGLVPNHVGIMVSDKYLLHVDINRYSECIAINHPLIKNRVYAFYRHTRFT